MFALVLARYLAMGWRLIYESDHTITLMHSGSIDPNGDTFWSMSMSTLGQSDMNVRSVRYSRTGHVIVAQDVRPVSTRSPHSALMDVRRSVGAVR